MKKFAVLVLVLALTAALTACGQSRSERIWEEATESVRRDEITTTYTEDGAKIQSFTISESFR